MPLGFDAGEDGRLIENERELATVKQIRALRRRGLSYRKIVDRLNSAGVPTKKGGRWSKSTVFGIIHNTIYA